MRTHGVLLGAAAVVAALVVACGSDGTDAPVSTDEPSEDVAADLPATGQQDDGSDGVTDGDTEAQPDAVESDRDVAGEDQTQPTDGPLAFSARSLDGGTVEVATFAGGPVAMWMWTPW